MKTDYSILKKHYGEKFAKFCKASFPGILEEEGKLSSLIMERFNPSRFLYDDLVRVGKQQDFIKYINGLTQKQERQKMRVNETPEELFKKAGYKLFRCSDNKDVLSFKPFYKKGEELCTFKDKNRIKNYHIFFAVKKNIAKIKREDFKNPVRQDEYGTSVICLQFLRGSDCLESIKNRYNHTVNNPDATFSNNLDEIIPGLTDSFEKFYGLTSRQGTVSFEMLGYVLAGDGRFYKFNYEINNVYYCPDNIIIKLGQPTKLDKERFELVDYFVIDRHEKSLYQPDGFRDGFVKAIGDIKMVDVTVDKENSARCYDIINTEGEKSHFEVDEYGRIVSFSNPSIKKIPSGFLYYNQKLHSLDCEKVEVIESFALNGNKQLRSLVMPRLKVVKRQSFPIMFKLEVLDAPNLSIVEDGCFQGMPKLKRLDLPSLEVIGDDSMRYMDSLEFMNLPSLKIAKDGFANMVPELKKVNAPNVEQLGSVNFYLCGLTEVDFPKLKSMGSGCFANSWISGALSFPSLEVMGSYCFQNNANIKELSLPNLKEVKGKCFSSGSLFERWNVPKVDEKSLKNLGIKSNEKVGEMPIVLE